MWNVLLILLPSIRFLVPKISPTSWPIFHQMTGLQLPIHSSLKLKPGFKIPSMAVYHISLPFNNMLVIYKLIEFICRIYSLQPILHILNLFHSLIQTQIRALISPSYQKMPHSLVFPRLLFYLTLMTLAVARCHSQMTPMS